MQDLYQLTISQLKQVAAEMPQPYRIHAQIESANTRETSQGKAFYEIRLNDGTDQLLWRVFDSHEVFSSCANLRRGQWLELGGQWLDTGKFGLEVRNAGYRMLSSEEIQVCLAGDEEIAEKQKRDFAAIQDHVEGMIDPRLKRLAQCFLETHAERFRRAAAARTYHHARRGGLVEHVAQMMRAAKALAGVYPHLHEDLLLSGVLFHDCGKLWENNYPEDGFVMPYSLHGEMLGHISLGLELVNKLWRQILEEEVSASWAQLEPPSEKVRLHLLHLISSHHGCLEYGSPILPKTPEAVVLHHVDNIDAKLEMFEHHYDRATELAPGIYDRSRSLGVSPVDPLPGYLPPNH